MTDKEKLDRMKKLADAMYTTAQYLTTDASGLRKAMEEYHKFIIYEYNKQEPASEDLEQASDVMATELFKEFFPQDGDTITPNDFCKGLRSFARHFADWQREQMIKDAIDTRIDKRLADMIGYTGSERVKVIIIKE